MKMQQAMLWSLVLLATSAGASASKSPAWQVRKQDRSHQTMSQGSMDKSEQEEVAHPFLTHMGMPEGVRTHSLRLSGLTTSMDGESIGDFAFHYETGLTSLIGFHLRNDDYTTNPFTEAMFQYAAIRSKDGMSGISPLIEFEFPTRRAGSGIKTLFGFSSTLTLKRGAINQVLHYEPRDRMLEGSVAYVWEASKGVYPVIELLGEAMRGEKPTVNVLFGPKFKIGKSTIVGFAYESPITPRKEFSARFMLQLEFKW